MAETQSCKGETCFELVNRSHVHIVYENSKVYRFVWGHSHMSRPQLPSSIDAKAMQCLAKYVNVVLKTCRFLFFLFFWRVKSFVFLFQLYFSEVILIFLPVYWCLTSTANHSSYPHTFSDNQSVKITCGQHTECGSWVRFSSDQPFLIAFVSRPSCGHPGHPPTVLSVPLSLPPFNEKVILFQCGTKYQVDKPLKFHNKGEETAFAWNHLLIRKCLCQKKKSADMYHRHAHVEACAMTQKDYKPELTKFGITTWARGNKSWVTLLNVMNASAVKDLRSRMLAAWDLKLYPVLCHRRRHSKWPNNDVF